MAIGDSISQPIPAVSSAGTTYASQLVAFLNEVKSRLVSKVPLSSLLISALDMANNAISNLAYALLYPQTSTPPVGSLYNSGGDLWWVSEDGAAQVTEGALLAASTVGAISGDYGGANPARFKFVDADQEFYAYDDEAGGAWARVWARGFDIAAGDTSSVRLRLAFAGTSYTWTFPAAAPSVQSILQIGTSGGVIASNTLADHLVLAANKDVTISGAARYKHGTRHKIIDMASHWVATGTLSAGQDGDGAYGFIGTASSIFYVPLSRYFSEWDRISSITFKNNNTGGTSHTYQLVVVDTSSGTLTGGTSVSSNANSVALNLSPYQFASTQLAYVKVTMGAGACTFIAADVAWDAA